MEFLGQGAQRLGEKGDLLNMDGYLFGLGFEYEAGDADDIADIILAEISKLLLGDSVLLDVELDKATVVLDVAENGLAHAALGHDTTGNGNGLILKGVKIGLYLGRPCASFILGLVEGIAAFALESRKLIAAYLKKLGQLLLGLGSLLGVVCYFAHDETT